MIDENTLAKAAKVLQLKNANGKRVEPRNDWESHLARTSKNMPQATIANAIDILSNVPEWRGVVAWDEFSYVHRIVKLPPWDRVDAPPNLQIGDWTDTDTIRLAAWFSRNWMGKCPTDIARDAIDVVARRNSVHPVREYLNRCAWDGLPRLDTWTTNYLGVAASAYTDCVGRILLVSAVARIMQPGCKVDTMGILQGDQGVFKSTAIRVLFGADHTSDTPPDLQSKDRFVGLRGFWAVEIPELDGLTRADAERIKSFLSSPVDDYRPPYGRSNVKVPRQCVLLGTTNGGDYLRDATGARRFLPLRVGRIDLDSLARDRDQLWAEAVARYREGATWWPPAHLVEDFREEQAERAQIDEWMPAIELYTRRNSFAVVGEILADVLHIELGKWSQADANRVARILVQLGRERRQRRQNGVREWGYVERGQSTPGVTSGDGVVT